MSDTKTIYIKGVLKSTYNATEKDDNGNIKSSTNIISIFRDGATDGDDKDINKFFTDFYKGKNAKWIPDWFKSDKDFLAIKSAYNIPVMTEWDNKQMSFAEWVDRGSIRGAKVIVKCNVKESAIYPNAMKVVEDGEPYDAFAEF